MIHLLFTVPFVAPAFATAAVAHDPDDPAIWVHPKRPAQSLILGTDKQEKTGGLYVFDLNGKVIQRIPGLDRPNNVDVEGNLVVLTERVKSRLRIFQINPQSRRLKDVTGETRVFEGEKDDDGAPMGVGLFRRPVDGAIFAFVTPKGGPRTDHLAQYRITLNPKTKRYDAHWVRRFGGYSGVKETESVCVDDHRGVVYYSDETFGTRSISADPLQADQEYPTFNRTGTKGDHEGIALWSSRNWLVCTDQIVGDSVYRVFDRYSKRFVGAFRGGADETDGIEICDRPLGPKFPAGIMVAMNSGPKNFLVYDLRDVAKAIRR